MPDFLNGNEIDETNLSDMLTRPADDWHYENAERVRKTFFEDSSGRLRFGIAMFEGTAYMPHEFSQRFNRHRDRLLAIGRAELRRILQTSMAAAFA
jgi:hypothetical protein